MVDIELKYGSSVCEVALPDAELVEELRMRDVAFPADPSAVIEQALDAPVESLPLEQLAAGAQRVTILVDDITRPTPIHLLLPSILSRLQGAGVKRDDITIMVALGTHRPMRFEELQAKLGTGVVAQYNTVNHDYKNDELVHLGETPSGVPITVNRTVVDSDFVIGVGNIVPHRYCGWAGGAKIVQPGVSGEATTASTHLMITKVPGVRLGAIENQVRHEIEAVAERVNLKFIVNTILDRRANIVDVVAGDFRHAFRKGVKLAQYIYSAPFKREADIVLASAYPSDINFWQAGKAFYSANLVVREGGIIVLASPCYEGVGEHEEFVRLLQYDYKTIEQLLAENKVKDQIGAAAALAVALVLARAEIWIVTENISDEQARQMNVRRFTGVQEALDAALEAKGRASQVTILHEATEILPLRSEQDHRNA